MPLGEGSADDALSELKGVEEERELLSTNIRSSVFFTTRDMSAMAGLNDRFALVEGRYLTALDDAEAAPVCVIRTELAASAGLAVGDRLSLRVWDLRYPGSAIRPDLEGTPLSQLPSTRLELTVVGIVHNLSQARAGEGWRGEIYLPESIVPETYDRLDFPGRRWCCGPWRSGTAFSGTMACSSVPRAGNSAGRRTAGTTSPRPPVPCGSPPCWQRSSSEVLPCWS